MNLPAAVASWEQIKISIHFQKTAHGYVEEPIKVLGFSKNNKRKRSGQQTISVTARKN